MAIEPQKEHFQNPFLKYFLATRPPFILASVVPVLVGLAYAHQQGYGIDAWTALLTLLAAIFLHAAVNVFNDYYDALNGTDERNEQRIFPFTGGSRFIQNGVLTLHETRMFGIYLLLAVIIIGVYLVIQVGIALILLGFTGIALGWAYSAPPLKLNSRGLGELTVLIGFSLLPVGSCLVQTGHLSLDIFLVALPGGLLTTSLLYINQFPDRESDIAAAKMHVVARLEPRIARWGYPLLAALAYGLVFLLILLKYLPPISLISVIPALLSLKASCILLHTAHRPHKLEPAIKLSIMAMLLHGLLLTLSLV